MLSLGLNFVLCLWFHCINFGEQFSQYGRWCSPYTVTRRSSETCVLSDIGVREICLHPQSFTTRFCPAGQQPLGLMFPPELYHFLTNTDVSRVPLFPSLLIPIATGNRIVFVCLLVFNLIFKFAPGFRGLLDTL